MAMTLEQKEKLRSIRASMRIAGAVTARAGNADEIISAKSCFEQWAPGNYLDKAGIVVVYDNYPYKLGQPHDSSSNPDWTPETQPALWWPYHGTTPETALPWRKPIGSHDIYKKGEMMRWTADKIMECLSDTNYSPTEYPQAWKEVIGAPDAGEIGTEEPTVEPEIPSSPSYPAWEQPTGAHNAYALGSRVVHNSKIYESTVSSNTWVPGVFGWIEVPV